MALVSSTRAGAGRRSLWVASAGLLLFVGVSCASPRSEAPQDSLAQQLRLLGHRNWLVVADSAYPLQSSLGITTLYVGGSSIDAIGRLLEAVDNAPNVRARVHLDQELRSLSESAAPGITEFRNQLEALLVDRPQTEQPHEQILAMLDEVSAHYDVVVFKTDATLPFTSVFVELECGYWP